MARILPDKEIKTLLGSVILDGDQKLVEPNGIKLRLGKSILFQSTGEEKAMAPGTFAKIAPGEAVLIASMEVIDFRPATTSKLIAEPCLMGFITPTTTMMREGVSQISTKVDAGFHGCLNWMLRNSSGKDLILQFGEPLFKLTFFALGQDESPEMTYGEGKVHTYQNTEGIKRSRRKLPADIPKSKIVSSSIHRLDPKKALREAGYPFDHVSTELTELHGKWEIVSSDVRLMKEEFQTQSAALGDKIDERTQNMLEKVEILFDRKFLRVTGLVIAAVPIMYGVVTFLQSVSVRGDVIAAMAVIIGVLIGFVSWVLSKPGFGK